MACKEEEYGGEDTDNLATLSINEIIFRFWRERLVVQPLAWTARQLHLLRCTFFEMSTPPQPSHTRLWNITEEPSVEVATAWGWMMADIDEIVRAEALQSLLACYSFTKLP